MTSSEPGDGGVWGTFRTRLVALAAFLQVFERADLVFGEWEGGQEVNGVIQMPWYSLGPEAQRFVSMAYESGWVRPFDWRSWAHSPEGRKLFEGGDAVARATPDDLARLLTTLIRAERFGDGQLEAAYASGLLTAIVRRAATLASEAPPDAR